MKIDLEIGAIYHANELMEFLCINKSKVGIALDTDSGMFLNPMFQHNKFKITDIKEICEKPFSFLYFDQSGNKISQSDGITKIYFLESIN